MQGKLCPKLDFCRRVQGKLCPKLDFCRRVPNNQNIVPINQSDLAAEEIKNSYPAASDDYFFLAASDFFVDAYGY